MRIGAMVVALALLSAPGAGIHASWDLGTLPPPGEGSTGNLVSGTVFGQDRRAAGGVEVRFWQPQLPTVLSRAMTEGTGYRTGQYRLPLTDGVWHGSPCASGDGYSPAFWRVEVRGGVVASFEERDDLLPLVTQAVPSVLRSGELVEVFGINLGCSGSLILDLPTGDQVVISEFIERHDQYLKFRLPGLPVARVSLGYVWDANLGAYVERFQELGRSGQGRMHYRRGGAQGGLLTFSFDNR